MNEPFILCAYVSSFFLAQVFRTIRRHIYRGLFKVNSCFQPIFLVLFCFCWFCVWLFSSQIELEQTFIPSASGTSVDLLQDVRFSNNSSCIVSPATHAYIERAKHLLCAPPPPTPHPKNENLLFPISWGSQQSNAKATSFPVFRSLEV